MAEIPTGLCAPYSYRDELNWLIDLADPHASPSERSARSGEPAAVLEARLEQLNRQSLRRSLKGQEGRHLSTQARAALTEYSADGRHISARAG